MIIVLIGVAIIAFFLYRQVKSIWNNVMYIKSINKSIPTEEEISNALEAFKQSYTKEQPSKKITDIKNEDQIAYPDMMYI